MSTIIKNGIQWNGDDNDLVEQESIRVYAEINKEAATMLSVDDMIVFGPAEDFEYTAPLEDFKKTQKAQN